MKKIKRPIPGTGWVYAGADYDGAEMRSWGQVCLDLVGHSRLAALYQANPDADPHCTMGAILLGVSEEEFIRRYKADDPVAKEYRQQSKPPNFGFPGGMGEPTMIEYAASQGIKLTPQRAKQARDAWRKAWPENWDYFKLIGAITSGPGKVGTIKQLRSGRIRGGVSFTQAANGFFQALTADGAKRALWLISWECYVGTKYGNDNEPSPLAGCRPVMFLHDEIIAEMREAIAHLAAPRMAALMIQGMREFLPDVPVRAAPVLSRRWVKGARPKFDAEGRLIPFEDAAKVAKAA